MTPSKPDPNRRTTGSQSDENGGGTKQKIKEDARDAKREVSARAREKAEEGQHRVADEADALSDAIDAAAANLEEHDREGLARYTREMGSRLSAAAEHLEGRSVDELAEDAKRLARENPALFMLGSVAIGFGLSRFFKASEKRDHHGDEHRSDTYQRDDTFRNEESFREDALTTGTPMRGREGDMSETYTTSTAPRSTDGRETL